MPSRLVARAMSKATRHAGVANREAAELTKRGSNFFKNVHNVIPVPEGCKRNPDTIQCLTNGLHGDYNLNMSRVEAIRFELAKQHNRALDFLGGLIFRLYGVKVEELEATKDSLQGKTAITSTATETRPPDVEKPS